MEKINEELRTDILNTVLDILNESHTDHNKKIPNTNKELQIQMACPVCGDSKKNNTKKRGVLYLDSFKYYCWNGDCQAKYWSIFKFFRWFNKNIKNIEHIKEISSVIKKTSSKRKNVKLIDSSIYFEYLYKNSFALEEIKKVYTLEEAKECKWGKEYLQSRALVRYRDNFLFRKNSRGNREVWVLNKIDENDQIVGLQIKNLDWGVKYTTKTFSTLHEEITGSVLDLEKDFIEKCNNFSTIFNIFNIEIDNLITIFEGPIDAMFIRNSLATAGASKLKDFFDEIPNVRYFFDNDKTGKINSIQKIKKGKRSFLWKRFFKENGFKDKSIKDLNDLILYVINNREHKDSLKKLDNTFSKTKYDIYHV